MIPYLLASCFAVEKSVVSLIVVLGQLSFLLFSPAIFKKQSLSLVFCSVAVPSVGIDFFHLS